MQINAKLPERHRIHLRVGQVIFGCLKRPAIINFMMLVGKQFITNQRSGERVITFSAYRSTLQKMFEMEKYLARCNDRMPKFCDRWRLFMGEGGKLDI